MLGSSFSRWLRCGLCLDFPLSGPALADKPSWPRAQECQRLLFATAHAQDRLVREGYAWLTNWLNIMETLQDRAGNPDISAILGAEGLIGVREKAVHPAVPSNASICASLHEPGP